MHSLKNIVRAALLLAVCKSAVVLAADSSYPGIDCDRACLDAIMDQYLDALKKQDSSRAPWSRDVKFSENGVVMKIGDGVWNTISGMHDYNLRVADPQQGQVAVFEVVEEHGVPAIMGLRLKVVDREITEVESVFSRKIDTSPFPVTEGLVTPDPVLTRIIPPDERLPRTRLISIADGYFDTIQNNDGTLFTRFSEDCNRIENGLLTTNNDTIPNYDIAKMGCEEQFRLGQYIYDDRLRDRRYPLVDEEKGIVLAAAFMDHSGKVMDVTWTDGTKQKSIFFYPHSFILFEMFKIEDGAIRRVEAVFASMPYNMPSVW